jgi:hypothetical protein
MRKRPLPESYYRSTQTVGRRRRFPAFTRSDVGEDSQTARMEKMVSAMVLPRVGAAQEVENRGRLVRHEVPGLG